MEETTVQVNQNNEVVITKQLPTPDPIVKTVTLDDLISVKESITKQKEYNKDVYEKDIKTLKDAYDAKLDELEKQETENQFAIDEAVSKGAKTQAELYALNNQ